MLGDRERKQEIAAFPVGGRPLRHHAQAGGILTRGVAVLHQHPARDRSDRKAGRRGFGYRARRQQADIGLLREHRERVFVDAGRDDHFNENFRDRVRGRRVDSAVGGDHPAEGAHRIAGEGARIGLRQRIGDRHPARVGVLDNGDGRAVELRD